MADDPKPDPDPNPTPDPAGTPDPSSTIPDELPTDHPARKALARANKEAADLRKKVKDFEDANKSEVEKATSTATEATKRAEEAELKALRLEVGIEKGLTPAQSRRLVGSNREELESDADELLESFGAGDADGKKRPPAKKPAARLRGGEDPEEEAEELDPRKLAANHPRF